MAVRTEFIAVGSYVPDRVVTNDELTRYMETSDEWIRQRTGIQERRWAEEKQSTTDLAVPAAEKALARAGLSAQQLDAIIFATLAPDHQFPGCAVLLQARLGVPGIAALDVRNQCSGFLYGLSVADAWIRAGVYQRVLLVGAEKHSCGLDISTRGRDVGVIFGDGAAAVVLGATSEEDRGVLGVTLGADGRFARDLWVEAPGSSRPHWFDQVDVEEGKIFPRMEGAKVFKHAVVKMPEAVRGVLEKNGATAEQLKLLIPHQANLRISEMVQRTLGLRDDQVFNNIQRYGNTTAASIPLALDEALQQGRLARGDLLAFAAFGAGFTWGAALVRW
jgi:3-oxoacyl-[acyl-carrier-protein] synthase-3